MSTTEGVRGRGDRVSMPRRSLAIRRPSKRRLRRVILGSLRAQGYRIRGTNLLPPASVDKSELRRLHEDAVAHWREAHRAGLERREEDLLRNLAFGREVDPPNVDPELVEIHSRTQDELLFRYAKLHWSIPVSQGYGRRLRYLVRDRSNGALIGIFGLCDPVIGLPPRDDWVGWTVATRNRMLRYTLDAYVMGAVPPYSYLLGGKLVAMLAASDEVRESFKHKYADSRPAISRERFDGRLAMITTTSALGKSAVYDRIRYEGGALFVSAGYTNGWGEFHFSNGAYDAITAYANRYCDPTQRNARWGSGFRNRRELIEKCLRSVGLPKSWMNHGIRREVFVVPLAYNTRAFLQGEHDDLRYASRPAAALSDFFKRRWMIPRSTRDTRFYDWNPDSWRLWSHGRSRPPTG